jgi:hypothetical protein
VVAENKNIAHPTGGEKTLRANRDSSNNSVTAREEALKNNRYCQVGDKTFRVNREYSNSKAPIREEQHNACQDGDEPLRADRDCATSRGPSPEERKGNLKHVAEGKKKSVQFSGGYGTKDDENHPMGEEYHTVGNKKMTRGLVGTQRQEENNTSRNNRRQKRRVLQL